MHKGCVLLFAFAFLSACGGGGGGGGGTTPSTPTPTPTVGPPTTTNASGTVVDDSNGSPLSGINVALEPWTAGATPIPGATTTDSSGKFTLSNVPNGHYLLVVGSNNPTDTTRATVHDNVTLSGGNQSLVAPTPPSMTGYAPPAWETNGTYRLTTLDATTEVPCFQRFNADRVSASEPQVPLDEWVMENVRAINDNRAASGSAAKPISSQDTFFSGGGGPGGPNASCSNVVDFAFPPNAGAFANDARVAWVGINYSLSGTTYLGYLESPFDPRGYTDPTFAPWP